MKNIFFVLLIAILSSCKEKILPPKPEELYQKYEKSVVLIRNEFYYKIELTPGSTAFFTGIDGDKIENLTFDEREIVTKANVVYGTGFFISNLGEVVTNRHVSSPEIDDEKAIKLFKYQFENSRQKIKNRIQKLQKESSEISNILFYNYNRLSYRDIDLLNERRQECDNERKVLTAFDLELDFNPNTSKINCVIVKIGIALNNTFVTNPNDFKDCVLKQESDNPDIDLSVIQLKDKTTPTVVKDIFNFKDNNPNILNGTMGNNETFDINKPLRINTKVYMVGFNHGENIASTEEGLKSQLTQGTVSQESDRTKVLYSIPSLEGSSGSPIIDEWGNLVAINFAKVSGTQNFNYGVLSKHLQELLKK